MATFLTVTDHVLDKHILIDWLISSLANVARNETICAVFQAQGYELPACLPTSKGLEHHKSKQGLSGGWNNKKSASQVTLAPNN